MVVIGHSEWHWEVLLDSWFQPHCPIPGLLCINTFSLTVTLLCPVHIAGLKLLEAAIQINPSLLVSVCLSGGLL